MGSLLNEIKSNWPFTLNGHFNLTVGFSGGIDSVVLLDLLKSSQETFSFSLNAIHINHGISTNSNNWQQFCEQVCINYNIPLKVVNYSLRKIPGQGLENTARQLRYKAFKAQNNTIISLAHHQNDQLETMLSQLMRGSNLHNSAGMSILSKKYNQLYWRPLLNISKQNIIDYAKAHNLKWIEDESNQDNHYLRNFIRNKLIPQMEKFDNNINNKLLNSINQIKIYVELADELAKLDLVSCITDNGHISLTNFILLTESRQYNLLAYWLKSANLPLPSQKQLHEFIRQTLTSTPDKHPQLIINPDNSLILKNKTIQKI